MASRVGSVSVLGVLKEGWFIAEVRWVSIVDTGRIEDSQKASSKESQIRNAPDILDPSFLSVGRIIFSSTRSRMRIFCIRLEGVVVLLGA